MTELTHEQIRDILPDYLHGNVDEPLRATIEAHLNACADCASEMRVIQMVKDAPSFAPMIDAVKVSSAILPYGGVPVAPARPRSRAWQMALAAAAVVLVTMTVVSRGKQEPATERAPAKPVASVPVAAGPSIATNPLTPAPVKAAPVKAVVSPKRSVELQVAAGLDGLSERNLAQLARELDGLDGLPSSEPESLGVSDPTSGSEGGK